MSWKRPLLSVLLLAMGVGVGWWLTVPRCRLLWSLPRPSRICLIGLQDDNTLLAADRDHHTRIIWRIDRRTGRELPALEFSETDLGGGINSATAALTADRTGLLLPLSYPLRNKDRVFQHLVWCDAKTGKRQRTYRVKSNRALAKPTAAGQVVVALAAGEQLVVWDRESTRLLRTIELGLNATDYALSEDGKRIVVIGRVDDPRDSGEKAPSGGPEPAAASRRAATTRLYSASGELIAEQRLPGDQVAFVGGNVILATQLASRLALLDPTLRLERDLELTNYPGSMLSLAPQPMRATPRALAPWQLWVQEKIGPNLAAYLPWDTSEKLAITCFTPALDSQRSVGMIPFVYPEDETVCPTPEELILATLDIRTIEAWALGERSLLPLALGGAIGLAAAALAWCWARRQRPDQEAARAPA